LRQVVVRQVVVRQAVVRQAAVCQAVVHRSPSDPDVLKLQLTLDCRRDADAHRSANMILFQARLLCARDARASVDA
jgi:hypothetical protein